MLKEFVWFDFFRPTDEFKEFLESIGYGSHPTMFFYLSDLNFDERVVEYVKNHINFRGHSMKGRETSERLIGFYGTATVLEVETDQKWHIRYKNDDTPYVEYLAVKTDNYGFTRVIGSQFYSLN